MGSHGGNRLVARFCDYTTGIGAPMVRPGRRSTVSILLILVPDRYRHLPRVGWISFTGVRPGPSPSDWRRGIREQGASRTRNSSSEPGAPAHGAVRHRGGTAAVVVALAPCPRRGPAAPAGVHRIHRRPGRRRRPASGLHPSRCPIRHARLQEFLFFIHSERQSPLLVKLCKFGLCRCKHSV